MIVCDIIFSLRVLPVVIIRSRLSPLRVQELWPIFPETFRCCSHKCLHGENGAAALIDTFLLGAGDGMPCWSKFTPYLGQTFFLIWLIIASQNYRDQT